MEKFEIGETVKIKSTGRKMVVGDFIAKIYVDSKGVYMKYRIDFPNGVCHKWMRHDEIEKDTKGE